MVNSMFNIATNVDEMVNVALAVENAMDVHSCFKDSAKHITINNRIKEIVGGAKIKAETAIPYTIRNSMMILYNGILDGWDTEDPTALDGLFSKVRVKDNISKLLNDSFSHIASVMSSVPEIEILLEMNSSLYDSLGGTIEKLDDVLNNKKEDNNMSKKEMMTTKDAIVYGIDLIEMMAEVTKAILDDKFINSDDRGSVGINIHNSGSAISIINQRIKDNDNPSMVKIYEEVRELIKGGPFVEYSVQKKDMRIANTEHYLKKQLKEGLTSLAKEVSVSLEELMVDIGSVVVNTYQNKEIVVNIPDLPEITKGVTYMVKIVERMKKEIMTPSDNVENSTLLNNIDMDNLNKVITQGMLDSKWINLDIVRDGIIILYTNIRSHYMHGKGKNYNILFSKGRVKTELNQFLLQSIGYIADELNISTEMLLVELVKELGKKK